MLAGLVASGELRLSDMIGRTIVPEEINDALALFETGEELRTVITYG